MCRKISIAHGRDRGKGRCQVAIPAAFFARKCGVRRGDDGTNAASCARRSILSWAVFVRSMRARCSYSGIVLRPPNSRLKRSSASSFGVIKISSLVLIASRPSDLVMRSVSDRRSCSRSIQMKVPLFRLRFDAPQLKAMRADRLFDRLAGKVKGRSSPRPDHANLSPRAIASATMLCKPAFVSGHSMPARSAARSNPIDAATSATASDVEMSPASAHAQR
jgi:hypothetical protein